MAITAKRLPKMVSAITKKWLNVSDILPNKMALLTIINGYNRQNIPKKWRISVMTKKWRIVVIYCQLKWLHVTTLIAIAAKILPKMASVTSKKWQMIVTYRQYLRHYST